MTFIQKVTVGTFAMVVLYGCGLMGFALIRSISESLPYIVQAVGK